MRLLLREFVQTTILAAGLFLVLQTAFQTFRVEQRSMEPTLREGQYLVVDKVAYLDPSAILARSASAAEPGTTSASLFGSPHRGDVVVFSHPTSPGQHLIKRVIGLPGETVEVRDHQVLVDGARLDEPYIAAAPTYQLAPLVVPPDQLFVLGDNRNNSYDSHIFGPIPRELVLGKAIPLPYFSLPRPASLPALFRRV